MIKLTTIIILTLILLFSCSSEPRHKSTSESTESIESADSAESEEDSAEDSEDKSESESDEESEESESESKEISKLKKPSPNKRREAGLITAGRWNDLSNWNFWGNLLDRQEYSQMSSYWDFHTNNRLSFFVSNNNTPIADAKIELLRNESVIWTARTDNRGYAELWVGLFQEEKSVDLNNLKIKVNNVIHKNKLNLIKNGVNQINVKSNNDNLKRVEISFIVDATGSMSDELNFLKSDLKNVINNVQNNNSTLDIYTSTVFYRDEGDDYVVKKTDFTNDLNKTIQFINKQDAGGGGDFPEAVHTALDVGINKLQWSDSAKTRIAFLLLDAPPHYTTEVKLSIHNTIKNAAKKGIKVIPISASGIDKNTEFLMRFMSIATNGTYVFITNHSGIGNSHIEASVGQYKVEQLNNLMINLIKKYSK